jgi:small GTP-binding protein
MHSFELMMVGNSGVGKSTLLDSFLTARGGPSVSKIESTRRVASLDTYISFSTVERGFKLYITDTVGQEKYRSLVASLFRKPDIIIFVIDSTDQASLEGIQSYWADAAKNANPRAIKMVALNKTDIHDEPDEKKSWLKDHKSTGAKTVPRITLTTVQMLMREFDIERDCIYETSGKHGYNVNALFFKALAILLEREYITRSIVDFSAMSGAMHAASAISGNADYLECKRMQKTTQLADTGTGVQIVTYSSSTKPEEKRRSGIFSKVRRNSIDSSAAAAAITAAPDHPILAETEHIVIERRPVGAGPPSQFVYDENDATYGNGGLAAKQIRESLEQDISLPAESWCSC